MKILSISDVITNSSSEVFIIDKSDLRKLPKSLQEYFTIIDKYNFIQEIRESGVGYALDCVVDLPNIFLDYNGDLEHLRDIYKDEKIIEFFEPLLTDILNKAVVVISDEYDYGFEQIELLRDIIKQKQISVINDRV